jgi:hypothetical protein
MPDPTPDSIDMTQKCDILDCPQNEQIEPGVGFCQAPDDRQPENCSHRRFIKRGK